MELPLSFTGPKPLSSNWPNQLRNDYYSQFTALANWVTGLDLETLMDCFISGLQKELQREIISQNPISLGQAISIARLFEDKFQITKPTNKP